MNNEIIYDDEPSFDKIQSLRTILKDSYESGFPVIKELIQNANDANSSSTFEISMFKGFPNANHLLLKNHPSLLIYNDGDFTAKDSKNIRAIHGAGKALDNTVVGKYGLGMKSIFHLCDMFFYVARITDKDTIEAKAWNPWTKDPKNRRTKWWGFSVNDCEFD